MESFVEKFCPVCKYKNISSATHCAFCGSPLVEIEDEMLPTMQMTEIATAVLPTAGHELRVSSMEVPEEGIAIYTTASGIPVAVCSEDRLTLGRRLTGEIDSTFVDLQPFDAYENGVSRRHALIQAAHPGYEIIDLGSTNGTWLEKVRLVPHQPYPLKLVSQVTLGRMQLTLVYQNTPKVKTG